MLYCAAMPHIVIVPGTNRAGSKSLHLARQVQSDYDSLGCSTDLLELAAKQVLFRR